MSDDIVLYDTEEVAKIKVDVKTFDLIPADWPVLNRPTEEFDFSKPPVDPNAFASTFCALELQAKKNNAAVSVQKNLFFICMIYAFKIRHSCG